MMKYKFEVAQTICKYLEIEAESENDAFDRINDMLEEGVIRFDDEPFLKMECTVKQIQ